MSYHDADPLAGLPESITNRRILSLKQAAALSGLSLCQYRRLLASGKLKVRVVQIGSRKKGIAADEAIRAHSGMVRPNSAD